MKRHAPSMEAPPVQIPGGNEVRHGDEGRLGGSGKPVVLPPSSSSAIKTAASTPPATRTAPPATYSHVRLLERDCGATAGVEGTLTGACITCRSADGVSVGASPADTSLGDAVARASVCGAANCESVAAADACASSVGGACWAQTGARTKKETSRRQAVRMNTGSLNILDVVKMEAERSAAAV